VAEWSSSVLTPPADTDEPRACLKYDVDTNNVTKVLAKLLLLRENDIWTPYSVDLFASRLHTNDHVEIQLKNVKQFQVTIFQ
jgi:hypothetical protein